jgi:hypothetical protein
VETTSKSKNRKFGLTLAALVLLPIFLLRLGAGQTAGAQSKTNQTTYTITDLGTLGGTMSVGIVNNRGAYRGENAFFPAMQWSVRSSGPEAAWLTSALCRRDRTQTQSTPTRGCWSSARPMAHQRTTTGTLAIAAAISSAISIVMRSSGRAEQSRTSAPWVATAA